MKKRRFHKAAFLLLISVIIVAALYLVFNRIPAKSNGNDAKNSDFYEIGTDIETDTTMIETQITGDIVKVDYIHSGLDTCNLFTALYSINQDKIIFTKDFGEDYWITGVTDNGFYVASLTKNEITLYDTDGEMRSVYELGKETHIAFLELCKNEKYLCYGNAQDCGVYVLNLENQQSKKVCDFYGSEKVVASSADKFYMQREMGNLQVIDALKGEVLIPDLDYKGFDIIARDFAVKRSDDVFFVTELGKYTQLKVPVKYVDEIPFYVGDGCFASVSSGNNGDIIILYDFKSETRTEINTEIRIGNICRISSDRLMVASLGLNDESPRLYILSTDKSHAEQYNKEQNNPLSTNSSSVAAGSVFADALKHIGGVPVIAQMPSFPTGCESVSAVMALQYAGVNITVDEFVDSYLERSSDFYYSGNERYGPDPNQYFIGNPRSSSAFGCYASVIERAAVRCFKDGSKVVNTTGSDLESLCSDYIDNDIPVVVWVTIDMKKPYVGHKWRLSDGTEFKWLANEHCMLLVGYTEDEYIFNDPYVGKTVKYKKNISQQRYKSFGMQSLAFLKI